MKLLKSLLLVAIVPLSLSVQSAPISLGGAEDYTLLSTGIPWHGSYLNGNLTLGSEAQIYGNVGARDALELASGAVVYGDALYGSLSAGAGSNITGSQGTTGESHWNLLNSGLQSASQEARAFTPGSSFGQLTQSATFERYGDVSVFNISGLHYSGGQTLTLSGNASDVFIVNVDNLGFYLGGGAKITLDGVAAHNVLFNLHADYPHSHVNVAAGSLAGTFIAPNGQFVLGDGLELNGARFLGGYIQGNLQTMVGIPPAVEVPEPKSALLLALGLLGLAAARRRNKRLLAR